MYPEVPFRLTIASPEDGLTLLIDGDGLETDSVFFFDKVQQLQAEGDLVPNEDRLEALEGLRKVNRA
jgi:hypothetical protein